MLLANLAERSCRILETASINTPIPMSRSLRTQELVVIKTTSAHPAVTELIVSVKVSIAESIRPPVPHVIANQRSPRIPWAAPVPTAVTRVVTIDKLVQLFILTAAATLAETRCRQQCEQKNAGDYQPHLAIAFHQLHNTLHETKDFQITPRLVQQDPCRRRNFELT